MEVITTSLCKKIIELLPRSLEIFTLPALTFKSITQRSSNLISGHLKMMSRLSQVDFSLRKNDPWKGSNYRNDFAEILLYRIGALSKIWDTQEEISRILKTQDKVDFEALNPIQVCVQTADLMSR